MHLGLQIIFSLAVFAMGTSSEQTPFSVPFIRNRRSSAPRGNVLTPRSDNISPTSASLQSPPSVSPSPREQPILGSKPDSSGVLLPRYRYSIFGVWKTATIFFFLFYVAIIAIFSFSSYAQTYLIYLHWINPPGILYSLTDLQQHRLGHTGRNVQFDHLQGWHILPPGRPFPPVAADDVYFESRLSAPNQRIILFFHGNAGSRAFPSKRVQLVKLLNSQLNSHVVTFDYSGFGDSGGSPSEAVFYADARHILRWVLDRAHGSSSVFVYGQSLGSFAATHVAARLARETDIDEDDSPSSPSRANASLHDEDTSLSSLRSITGVLLDAPPASLQTAARTHPVMRPFRAVGLTRAFGRLIRERHDSTRVIAAIRVPLIIMHGQGDLMIPPWQGRLLAERARAGGNTRVRYVEFERVGHVDVSGADGYLRYVDDFIRSAEEEMDEGPAKSNV